MINLNQDDIARLYGNKLWVIPDASGTQTAEVSPTSSPVSAETAAATTEKVSPARVANPEVSPEADTPRETPASNEAAPAAASSLKVKWGLKPDSQVIFIMSQTEKADKSLTGLLKKIVQSLEIPTDKVGFGFVAGEKGQPDLKGLPGSFAIIFGKEYAEGGENPAQFEGKPVFFAHTLSALSENREFKLELWNYMKSIKSQIH